MSDVRSLLFPRSIAVVGASPRNVAAVETVVASGVRAWGVNPNRDEVAGLRCYPSVAELPEVPECAFLMVNHERVEDAFEDAAAAGVRAFVVPGVGAEAGAAGEADDRAPREREPASSVPRSSGRTAWDSSFRAARPRGTGARRTRRRRATSRSSASRARSPTPSWRSADASGCAASSPRVRRRSRTRRTSSRSSPRTPGTRAVGLFLETVRRPDAFVEALHHCAEAEKPVVCLKVGRSEAAARAALTHTGALVGSGRAFSAVLRRYSAIEVGDFHELVETLEILGRERWPRGTRIAGISESGGECALLADHAEAAGIPFEPLSPELGTLAHGRVPELPRAGKPARRVGDRRRDGGLPAIARAPGRVGRVRRARGAGRPLAVPRPVERRVVRADAANARSAGRRARRRSSAP